MARKLLSNSLRTAGVVGKTLLLLLPLTWMLLQGPQANKVMFVGGAFACLELFRKRSLSLVLRAWPIALLVLLYILTSWIAPEVKEGERPYNLPAVLCTLIYGLPAGVCLALWSRHQGQGPVLLAYALFCLTLALAANTLIQASVEYWSTRHVNYEMLRANPDEDIQYWKFFTVENAVMGIIPMTLFGLVSIILVLVPGWTWHKIVILVAGGIAVYANVLAATRTTLLTAVLTLACLLVPVVLQRAKRKHNRKRSIILSCLGFVLFMGIAAYVFTSSDRYLLLVDRFWDLSDDPRKDVWIEAAGLLFNNPMGGGIAKLKTEAWAHNMFLDFGMTNGFAGMLFMAAAYVVMLMLIWKAVRKARILQEPLGVVLLAGFIASFISNLTLPPQATFIAFNYIVAAFCLVLVRLRRKSTSPALSSTSEGIQSPALATLKTSYQN